MYLTEKVRGAERKEEHAKGSCEDQTASTGEVNTNSRHAVVLNWELDRSSSAKDEEVRSEQVATKGTSTVNDRG